MSSAKKSKTTEWGLTQAVEALSHLEGEAREKLLLQLKAMDPEVAEELDKRMFRFEDLMLVNEKGLAELLRDISEPKLCLSLRGAHPSLLEKIFSCFSGRKIQMLSESIQDMGPQPKSKVDEARAEIIAEAKKRIQDGRMVIASKSDPLV